MVCLPTNLLFKDTTKMYIDLPVAWILWVFEQGCVFMIPAFVQGTKFVGSQTS